MIKNLSDVVLYAWVGFDEVGETGIGLKQGLTPCGLIPLVAVRMDRMTHPDLVSQLESSAKYSRKNKVLCRFKFDGVQKVVGVEK